MLDNTSLSKRLFDSLQRMPLEKDCPTADYQTKVEMYDDKCANCGFKRLVIRSIENSNRIKLITNNLSEALGVARSIPCIFERSCSYPGNVVDTAWGEEYPTLNEIVSNTCRLWYDKKLESDDEAEI